MPRPSASADLLRSLRRDRRKILDAPDLSDEARRELIRLNLVLTLAIEDVRETGKMILAGM